MQLPGILGTMQQAQEWVMQHPYHMAGIGVGFLGACYGLGALQRRLFQPRNVLDTHGTSRWATSAEIRSADLMTQSGVVLGRVGRQLLCDASDGHVLICGPTRSGKDQSHNFPTTVLWPGSMLIFDVKKHGENLRECGAWRKQLGPVYRVAPSQHVSADVNLLDTIRVGQAEEWRDVTMLWESILRPQKAVQQSAASSYYRDLTLEAGRAGTLYVLHTYEKAQRNFPEVLAFLGDMKRALRAMQSSQHYLIRETAGRLSRETEDRRREAWNGVWRALSIYRDPLIAHHTRQSSFALRDLQYSTQPITVYLMAETPGELAYLLPLYRPLLEQSMLVLMREENPAWSLCCIFNEFHELGYVERLEHDVATVLEYQMRFVFAVQALGQLFDTYGQHTPLFDNTMTKIFHRPGNPKTAELISEAVLGPQTAEYETASVQRGGMQGQRRGTHMQRVKRWLLDASELMRLSTEEAIVLHGACDYPILCQKVRYWRDREFQQYRRVA